MTKNNGEVVLYQSHYDENDVLGSEAGELTAEIMNSTVTGEFRGVSFQDVDFIQLPTGEEIHLVHMIATAIKAQLAEAYFAGRADQIADSYRTSVKRTLRAKDLPLAIDAVNAVRVPEDRIDKQALLDEFRDERGASLPRPLFLNTSSPELAAKLLEYIEAGDIRILDVEGEEADVLPLRTIGEENQGEHDD